MFSLINLETTTTGDLRKRLLIRSSSLFEDAIYLPRAFLRPTTFPVSSAVVNELEGLARGGQRPTHPPSSAALPSPSHSALVAEGARSALALLRNPGGPVPGVRCVTTRGTVLPSTTFTVEEDDSVIGGIGEGELRGNDDRILATCLSLVRAQENRYDSNTERGGTHGWRRARHVFRDVVLLTEDRNLRVKALARDVPTRGVEWFLNWATRPIRSSNRSSKCPSPPSQRGSIPPPGPLAT
ncbi:hypothetical protein J437_LFUL003723 [Ladona fulva]|uniref:PIN domain-containing protein n=1 Tax=Ladona fulva TaxID=123851 RepID=A0A8K0JX24_LADFU|nr:hypothetical protein J437_LFUL003723 [Ladona fulva]